MPARRAGLRSQVLRWSIRVLLPVIAFGLALGAFRLGVDCSDRPGIPGSLLSTQVYYTLGLFVLGGLDLGVPTGGPVVGQFMLWTAYFLAPLVTTSALIEGILRAINPTALANPLNRHIVMVGCGRLAMVFLQRIREIDPGRTVLIVEQEGDKPTLEEAVRRYGARVLIGDVRGGALLDRMALKRAHRLLLLTGDDFVNLDTATRALDLAPHLAGAVTVHLWDGRMAHTTARLDALQGARVFNTHTFVATHLVRDRLLEHFERTAPRDVVVLAGFGRFGQAVLRELQARAAGAFDEVVIVDIDAESRARIFQEQYGFDDGYHRKILQGDLRDPAIWKQIDPHLEGHDKPVFLLGSGDDGTNVRTAIWLSTRFEDAYIVARTFRRSVFAEHVAEECGFGLVSVSELLETSMPAEWIT